MYHLENGGTNKGRTTIQLLVDDHYVIQRRALRLRNFESKNPAYVPERQLRS